MAPCKPLQVTGVFFLTVLYSTTAKLSLLFEIMCAFIISRATITATSANAVFAVKPPCEQEHTEHL